MTGCAFDILVSTVDVTCEFPFDFMSQLELLFLLNPIFICSPHRVLSAATAVELQRPSRPRSHLAGEPRRSMASRQYGRSQFLADGDVIGRPNVVKNQK